MWMIEHLKSITWPVNNTRLWGTYNENERRALIKRLALSFSVRVSVIVFFCFLVRFLLINVITPTWLVSHIINH